MTAPATQKALTSDVFQRYQSNLPRHILGVANYLQTQMMAILRDDYGHTELRLSFAPYINLVGESELRVSELADILGISRQACNQAAQQVEAAGYLQRIDDPLDGRAKQMRLTTAGVQLRKDGLLAIKVLNDTFSDLAGANELHQASKTLGKLYMALQLSQIQVQQPQAPANLAGSALAGMLPRLSDYIMLRLMELTKTKGHPGLKLSFGQVLPFIGHEGGRIQEIAALHDVSKQAISAIATELETLHYLRRDTHPSDARQLVLQFTPRGEALIADSVQSTDELEAEFTKITGQSALKKLKTTLKAIYLGLQLDQSLQQTSTANGATDLRLLAQQLRSQLGDKGSLALAKLLTAPEKQPSTVS
ncbi:MAG: MarR family winged helix-turn-helix transcriptional regulator [Halioglobus sp.]